METSTRGSGWTKWVDDYPSGRCKRWLRNGHNAGTYKGGVAQVKRRGMKEAATMFHGRGTLRDAQGEVVVRKKILQQGDWVEDTLVKSYVVEEEEEEEE